MIFRKMTPADAAAAEALVRLVPETAAWFSQGYAELLQSAGGFGFVAETAEDSVARVLLGFVIARQITDEAEILNLAVDRSARRQGLGSRLLQSAVTLMAELGSQRVFLEVRESNFPARQLYERAGFQAAGRRKNYYAAPTEDALILERKLSRSE